MKILLTGASGLVGAAVARQAAAAGHTVIGLVGRWAGGVAGTAELHAVDLTNAGVAASWILRSSPDVIINAAAVSEPAACETAPELSQAMNVELPVKLAEGAAKAGARFIHISSEQVFDGEHPPYSVGHATRPLNLYGRQKVESEVKVLAAHPAAAVVRAPLLLGNSLSGRRSVHEKLFELWAGGEISRLYADEFRQVCSAENLASALLELAVRKELHGALHWAGAESISRYELGRRMATSFGLPENLVAAIWRADTPAAAAKRPANLGLDLAPLAGELKTKPQRVQEVLHELVIPPAFAEWHRSHELVRTARNSGPA